jgi:hypothetical protein
VHDRAHVPTWRWQRSRTDGRVHAFPAGERPASHLEAACSHTVALDRVEATHAGARCLPCLLIFGDQLAELV